MRFGDCFKQPKMIVLTGFATWQLKIMLNQGQVVPATNCNNPRCPVPWQSRHSSTLCKSHMAISSENVQTVGNVKCSALHVSYMLRKGIECVLG